MEYALSYWLPLHGQGAVSTDPYDFRSGMGTNMAYAFDFYTPDAPFWGPLMTRVEEYRRVRPLFTGDFYPLTPYSTAKDAWIAWQFDRPDLGEGMAQAFRRPEAGDDAIRLKLQGLDRKARYVVTNLDEKDTTELTGEELMKTGLTARIESGPGSAIFTYKLKAVEPQRHEETR
jgi:alpha-galactosidase